MLTISNVDLENGFLMDAFGEAEEFLRKYQRFEACRLQGFLPVAIQSERKGTQAYGWNGVGLPIPNYAPAPELTFNQLYWPTGATRWARFYGMMTGVDKDLLVEYLEQNPGDTLTLAFGDEDVATVEAAMYLLPPRLISSNDGNDSLWLIPLVDVRYWWQHRHADEYELTTWTALVSHLATQLGVSITQSSVVSAYLNPDSTELSRYFNSIPVLLDAIAHSIGQRVVRRLDGSVRMQDSTAAYLAHQDNRGLEGWTSSAGGENNLFLPVPEKIIVTFPKYAYYHPYCGEAKHSEEADTNADLIDPLEGSFKIIHSTLFADFTGGSASPDNNSDLDALATQIAADYSLWVSTAYDQTFNGVKSWNVNGFDDAVLWSFGTRREDGKFEATTRAWTHPPDFGVEQQLSQHTDLIILESPIWGFLNEMLTQGGSAEMSVCAYVEGVQTDLEIDVDVWDTLLNVADEDVEAMTRAQAFWSCADNRWIVGPINCAAETEEDLPQPEV